MNRYKIGDIFLNKFAGHIDCRYFIYLGVSGDYIRALEYINKAGFRECKYYKKDIFNKKYHDGTPAYVKVGHTNFLDIAKNDLLIEKKKDKKCEVEE